MTDALSNKLIGYRVKAARVVAGMTQEQLSQSLKLCDRQAVSDIENGKRALKPHELTLLTELYHRPPEFFSNPFTVAGEALFSWRASPEVSQETLLRFEERAAQWIGLLRWLRERSEQRASVLKRILRLSMHSSFDEARECGERLVAEFNLGVCPVERLLDTAENVLGIPVLFVDMPEAMTAATCHMEQMDAVLLNRQENEPRLYFSLAHELFHALTWEALPPEPRETNVIDERAKGKGQRTELLANHFAAALLMPRSALDKVIDAARLNDIAHLCDVAELLRVNPAALAWRLVNLKLINEEMHQRLSREKRVIPDPAPPKLLSANYVRLLQRALAEGHLSNDQATQALGVTGDDLHELFAEYGV